MIEHFWQRIPGNFTFPDFYSWVVPRWPNPHFVEVGVKNGQSAAFLGAEMINYGTDGDGRLDLVDVSLDAVTVRSNLAPVIQVVKAMWHLPSVEAAKNYANCSLDMVYIDADHTYENVLADIEAWKPKIRPGGILAGHDYTPSIPDVVRAVNERFARFEIFRGIEFDGIKGNYFPTWCVKL